MKILWITNRPIGAGERKLNLKPKSGTWLEPALNGLKEYPELSIDVSSPAKVEKVESFSEDGVGYYFFPSCDEKIYPWDSEKCKNVWKEIITSSHPDLIVIWGTEYAFGLCAETVAGNIPVVIEIQGIVASVWQYYLGGMTAGEIIKSYSIWNIIKHTGLLKKRKQLKTAVEIEKKMIEMSGNIIVENEWATCRIKAISPRSSIYYHNLNINEAFLTAEKSYDKTEKNSVFCSAPGYPLKGLHYLIRALGIVKITHPNIKLYVPGINDPYKKSRKSRLKQDGYEKYIMKLIDELDLRDNIVFLGRLSSQQMSERMVSCEVMVIPSAIENHSITLREAMTIGMPCIASYVGGIPEVLYHKQNGLLYRFDDYQQCAYYINMCLENKEMAQKMGENARNDMLQHIHPAKTIKQLVDIYNEVVNKSRSPQ